MIGGMFRAAVVMFILGFVSIAHAQREFRSATRFDPHWNVTLGLATLLGRFIMIIPILALAGNLAGKKLIPVAYLHRLP